MIIADYIFGTGCTPQHYYILDRVVRCNNVILDLNGHTITGDGATGFGVLVEPTGTDKPGSERIIA